MFLNDLRILRNHRPDNEHRLIVRIVIFLAPRVTSSATGRGSCSMRTGTICRRMRIGTSLALMPWHRLGLDRLRSRPWRGFGCAQDRGVSIGFLLVMAVGTLYATQKARLTGYVDGASGFALATEIACANLVRSVGPRTGVEPRRGQLGSRIDLEGCRGHDVQPD